MKFQINTFDGKQGGLQYIGLSSSSLTGYRGKEYPDMRHMFTVCENLMKCKNIMRGALNSSLIHFFKFKHYSTFTQDVM